MPAHPRSSVTIYASVAIGLFVYLTVLRTWDITQTFCLLGDQILYWNMAMGRWTDLPVGGGPTSLGGTTLGPVFCWLIWVIGRTVGPFTDYLPHAGGIGISLIQSLADALLFVSIGRRFGSLLLALGVVLLAATSPSDMSLTATIWNPPVAVAFIKLSIAAALWRGAEGNLRWELLAIVPAWLAVQAHSSAIFFAVPLIASFTVEQGVARRWRQAITRTVAAAATILVLQTPHFVDQLRHPSGRTSPQAIVESTTTTLANPALLRPAASFLAATGAIDWILFQPGTLRWPGAVLLACAAVASFRLRREPVLLALTVVPLAAAVAGFSLWQHRYEIYWFLTIAPSAALTIGIAITTWSRLARPAALLVIAALLVAQPLRSAESLKFNRLPEYGALVRGSRQIRKHLDEVRAVQVTFPLPPSTETDYLYKLLGGRVAPHARYVAMIDRSGRVVFGQPAVSAGPPDRPPAR